MRNLKKILALALALVMTLSLMTVANAFNDDKDIDAKYDEAVTVLSELKVFKGVNDGSNFAPKQTITRAEVAAIIYRIVTGDVADNQAGIYKDYAKFKDVAANHWAAGYIGYCSNAELILGDGTNFYPDQTVTGYQALAMILRAVGYDKNNEFQGNGWEIRTASTAQGLGILKNINQGTLGTAATREMVAEILFQAILVPTVTYTPALGYSQYVSIVGGTKNDTLGYRTFKLLNETVRESNVWGQPSTVWKLDTAATFGCWSKPTTTDKTLVSFADTPVASYTVKVDECEIAKDLGLNRPANLEAAYIDGVSQTLTSADVTTNRYPTINPLATTSYVGAQGRLTEVYAMENGTYRLVEINTYLAVVSGVKAAYTDRNGHVIPATTTFTVYQNKQGTATKTYTYQSDAFTVGQYALVKIVNPNGANTSVSYIAEATATTPVTSGTVVRYTNGSGTVAPTTTVGQANPYNDADKFILMGGTNYNNKQATLGKGYSVFADQYGNIIGLAEMTNNYLVVEAIRWIHDGTLRGGYALADVVLADGSRVQNVTVSTVGGVAVTNTSTSSVQNIGNPKTAFVSDYWTNNSAYYNHLTTYSVNADGTYNLGYNTAGGDICFGNDNTAKSATITTGLTTITGAVAGSAINYVVANDSTVFLVKQADGTYTTYVGKNNVPSMTNATICYLTSGGYATVVLVTEYTVAANTFVAYVSDNAYTGRVTGLGNEYVVWKADGTATYVYSNDSTLLNGKPEGFYTLEVANNGVVASFKEASTFMGAFGVNDVEAGTYAGPTVDGYSWDRAFVDSLAGNSLRATTAGDAQFADYFVDNAKYFVINKTAGNGVNYTTVTETTSASVAENQKIIVAYTMVGGVKHAQYVYICTTIGEDINNPVTPANVTSITAKDDGSVYLTLSADAKVGDTYQFTVEKLGDNGYVYVGTFNATVQGNTKAAWVNLSHILSNGTYQVKCGSLTDIHTYT